jgi:ParB-like chromosome segregation protein Spo0J
MDDDEYLNSLMEQATTPEYQYGELSTVFPSFVGEEEFTRLVEDIRENGLIDPIVVWNNEIVDGRHRHLACKEAGVEPRYEVLPDDWPFEKVKNRVVALNILRRHLSVGQRALVAAALANMSVGRNWDSNSLNLDDNKSMQDAADTLSVSRASVATAKSVKRDAPDLAEKVNNGEMSLNAADQERRKRLGMPTQTNAPKPKVVDLDQLIREQGDNFDGYVCAANIMTAARDLFLQEGETGIEENLMSAVRDSNKHKLSYNVAGLIALHDVLCKNIEELREISTPIAKTAYN